MNTIKEISEQIKDIALDTTDNTEVLKQLVELCNELNQKKEELRSNLNELCSDYNKMAQVVFSNEEDADNTEYKCLMAKKDAITTCLKIVDSL